jgi:hypothetical protein
MAVTSRNGGMVARTKNVNFHDSMSRTVILDTQTTIFLRKLMMLPLTADFAA